MDIGEMFLTIIVAIVTSGSAWFLFNSLRKVNLSKAALDKSKAESEDETTLQTRIDSLITTQEEAERMYKENLESQKQTIESLKTQQDMTDEEIEKLKKNTVLYRGYITYIVSGNKKLDGQIKMLGAIPVFVTMTLEEYEEVYNSPVV